jgi:hypothetical protein
VVALASGAVLSVLALVGVVMTALDVALLVVGLGALVVAGAAASRGSAMRWLAGGLALFGVSAVVLALLHWSWVIAFMVIGGAMFLVAGAMRAWDD